MPKFAKIKKIEIEMTNLVRRRCNVVVVATRLGCGRFGLWRRGGRGGRGRRVGRTDEVVERVKAGLGLPRAFYQGTQEGRRGGHV
jgi:hypothetical protein